MPKIADYKKSRIIFMGTPEFALESLKHLHLEGFNIVGVISAPGKPGGRGLQIQVPPVARYALENGLTLLQPSNLKGEEFLKSYRALKPDLNVVVAFRMLPKQVWEEPSIGTFNLHASLLPLYRGAAPINWAIINGEKETGLTTFLIDDKIDTGNILYRESVKITDEETAGSLHDKLMKMGPLLIEKTIKALCWGIVEPVSQESLPEFMRQPLPTAPKLSKETGSLDPFQKANQLYALIRGLSPYPGSYFEVSSEIGEPFKLRIGEVSFEEKPGQNVELQISGTQSGELCFNGDSGSLIIKSVQVPGKRMVKSSEFLNGWRGGTIRLNKP